MNENSVRQQCKRPHQLRKGPNQKEQEKKDKNNKAISKILKHKWCQENFFKKWVHKQKS